MTRARCIHRAPWYAECWKCREEGEATHFILRFARASWEVARADSISLPEKPAPLFRVWNGEQGQHVRLWHAWAELAERFRVNRPTTPVLRTAICGIPVLFDFPLDPRFWLIEYGVKPLARACAPALSAPEQRWFSLEDFRRPLPKDLTDSLDDLQRRTAFDWERYKGNKP